jgi:hypothetical protein
MATPTTLPATFVAGNVLTAAQMNNLRGAFRILQVIQTVKTDTFTTTSTSFVDITGLTATITPSATTSKILIVGQVAMGGTAATRSMGFLQLAGGNAGTYIGDAAGSRIRSVFGGLDVPDNANFLYSFPIVYLDSPATTSATTYKIQMKVSANTGYINRSEADSDDGQRARGASSITVMEISA